MLWFWFTYGLGFVVTFCGLITALVRCDGKGTSDPDLPETFWAGIFILIGCVIWPITSVVAGWMFMYGAHLWD